MLLGDFNSKLGDTCDRGRELQDFIIAHDLQVLNNSTPEQPQPTYKELQDDGTVRYQSTLDYALVNAAAKRLVDDFRVVFQPRKTTSKKFHGHLVLTLQLAAANTVPASRTPPYLQGPRYRWRRGAEHRWSHHTAGATFQAGFTSVVSADYPTPEDLHDAVEQFLCAEALRAGCVDLTTPARPRNPNHTHKLRQPWFDVHCRAAKHTWVQLRKTHGRHSLLALAAHRTYLRANHAARTTFWNTLP